MCSLPGDLDVVVRRFGHEEFPGDLHLGGLCREVAEEAALLLDEEELGQLLGLGLQDLDPLLELGDEVVKFHGARDAEVKVCSGRRGGKRCVYNKTHLGFTQLFYSCMDTTNINQPRIPSVKLNAKVKLLGLNENIKPQLDGSRCSFQ